MATHYGRLYIFGGCNYSASFNTLWIYEPEKDRWTQVPDADSGALPANEAPAY